MHTLQTVQSSAGFTPSAWGAWHTEPTGMSTMAVVVAGCQWRGAACIPHLLLCAGKVSRGDSDFVKLYIFPTQGTQMLCWPQNQQAPTQTAAQVVRSLFAVHLVSKPVFQRTAESEAACLVPLFG